MDLHYVCFSDDHISGAKALCSLKILLLLEGDDSCLLTLLSQGHTCQGIMPKRAASKWQSNWGKLPHPASKFLLQLNLATLQPASQKAATLRTTSVQILFAAPGIKYRERRVVKYAKIKIT